MTHNGARKKPLKENCSYHFNWTVVFYQTDPRGGNTVKRGNRSWLVRAPYAEGRKPQFSKLCLFAISYHLDRNWSVSVVEMVLLVARVFGFKGERGERDGVVRLG